MSNFKTDRWAHILSVTAVLTLVFIAYANSLKNDFLWDDNFLIRDNLYIRSLGRIGDIFRTPLAYSSGNVNNFYRPIQELSYMADHLLWGQRPFGFHLTSVILHGLCAVCVYFLSLKILKDRPASFITASLFGVHPINTETVAYIASRANILCLLFLLLSFILFLASIEGFAQTKRPRPRLYTAAVSFYLLALLSKEIAIALPAVFVVYILAFWPAGAIRNRLYGLCVPFGLVAAVYAIARSVILGSFAPAAAPILGRFNIFTRLLTALKTFPIYLGLIAAPFDLHMERALSVANSILEPQTLWALAVFLGLVAVVSGFYIRSKRLFFAGSWFFAWLLPVCNIAPLNSFITESWMYMPAIGIYMTAGVAADNLFFRGGRGGAFAVLRMAAGALIVTAALVFYTALTIERNKDWRDEVTFFKNTLRYSPDNGRLRLNLGNAYYRRGEKEKALEEYEKAVVEYKKVIETGLGDDKAYRNVGVMCAHLGRYDDAKFYLEMSLAMDPEDPQALYTLGVLYEMAGDYAMAEIEYTKTIDVMPDYARCHMQLGKLCLRTGRIGQALAHWKKALEVSPDNDQARELIEKYSK